MKRGSTAAAAAPAGRGRRQTLPREPQTKDAAPQAFCGAVKYGQRLRFTAVTASKKRNPSILILNYFAKLLIN